MNGLVNWRQPGLYDADQASLDSALDQTGQESMTQQHFGPETDINTIVRRYGLTGELPIRRELGEYGDFDTTMDFQQLIEQVKVGERVFLQVPADIRARFGNDAATFLEWIHEDTNYDEAATMGLVPKRQGAPVVESVPAIDTTDKAVAADTSGAIVGRGPAPAPVVP